MTLKFAPYYSDAAVLVGRTAGNVVLAVRVVAPTGHAGTRTFKDSRLAGHYVALANSLVSEARSGRTTWAEAISAF